MATQIGRRAGVGVAADLFGGAAGYNVAALDAGARAHINQVVCDAQDLYIMLDDHHRISPFHKLLEDGDEFDDVVGVQTDGRLVEEVEGVSRGALGELFAEADPLRLSPREGCDLLSKTDVAKADSAQGL